ncbi:hypothetical protein C8Q74DRAFT_1216610 [Fomes fomentarius]|nr:hypothetical protein C8Q74DRAFT_1216610 [Fomes fomentarius]
MSELAKHDSTERRIEDIEKEVVSISSGETSQQQAGIDAEVAEFFAKQGTSGPTEIDEETNRRLRWMVHKRVLVVMVTIYFAQALDKGTINFASIMGIIEDTNLHGQQYPWLTTCVYIAILIWEFPTNRLIQRLPIAEYLAFNIAAWGAVLATTAVCEDFTGLTIVHTLLGVFECVWQPAFVYMSTMWYRREEQALVFTNGMPTGLGAFANLIIKDFGHTVLQTYLLNIAQGAVIIIYFSGAILLAIIYTLPNIIGMIVFLTVQLAKTPSLTMAFGAVSMLNLAVMSNNVAGRTKQVVASSLVFIAWAVGNAVGPQVFRADDAPRYIKAFIAHMVMYALQVALLFFLRGYLMRQNVLKRRAAALRESTASGEDTTQLTGSLLHVKDEHLGHRHAFDDLTDQENPDFRYTY